MSFSLILLGIGFNQNRAITSAKTQDKSGRFLRQLRNLPLSSTDDRKKKLQVYERSSEPGQCITCAGSTVCAPRWSSSLSKLRNATSINYYQDSLLIQSVTWLVLD